MGNRGDRKNYVMSVELALQREMAYRRKLEKQALTPLKCPFTQMPVGISTSTSNQDSSSTPQFNGSIPGPQNHSLLPRAPPCPYPYPYPNPNPHPSSVSKPGPSSGPSSVILKQKGRGPPDGVFTCQVCQIDCKTGFNLLNHYQGHKHKAKLRTMKGKDVSSVAIEPSPKPNERETRPYCDVCGIWCTDEFMFRLHYSCTNHILRQYDRLMKTRGYL